MDPFRKNKLDQMVDQHKQWEPSRMLLTVGSKVHNLIEYIGKDCVQPEGSTLLLPSIFNSTDKATRNMLLGALRYVASDAGFMLAVKGWVAGDCRLVLKCQRGFVFKSQQELSKVGKKATSTIRPMSKEHECPFFICVKWDNEKQQYKLVAGHGNRRHCHHLPKEPCDVRKGVAFQSDEQRRLNIGLYASGATSQLVRNYHLETNGNTIADGTLDYLRRLACNKSNRAVAVALGHKRVNNLGKKPLTKAEKLLQYLQSVPDVSYIALYSEQKSDLLKVSHRDFKAACRRRQLRVVRRAADELSEQEGEVLDFTQFDESLDFETFESTTRQAMAMPDKNKMLLMVAWTTNYSCRKLCQYPQSTSSDTVEKLNNVQRCLYMFALTTPNRKNVPVMWTYLPAQSQWAFKWAQTRAFTFLFPSWARQKMHLHITDGDKNLYDPFRGAIQDGIFPNCVHRLCGYHFRSRGELTKTTTTKLESKGRAYYRIIKAWIRSWCCYIETLAEYEESRSIFNKWIDSDEVTNKASLTRNIAVLISKSLLTSFDPNLHKFLRCHFMKVFGYDKEASQSSETENSVIKRGPTNPSQSISRCTEGIVCNNQSREKKNNQKSAVSIDQQRVLGKIAMWKMALDELVDTAYKTCLEQSAKSEKLVLWRVSETQFYVKVRLYKDHQGKTYDSHNFDLYMVPYFERTRVVTVKTDGHGKKYLTCTCCLYERHRIPCADQLKVLGRMPTTQDCSLIHTSTYEHCYLKPGFEDVTNKMTEVLDSELDGPHFGEDADKMWIVGKSGNPETPLRNFWYCSGQTQLVQAQQAGASSGISLQEESSLSQQATTMQQQFVIEHVDDGSPGQDYDPTNVHDNTENDSLQDEDELETNRLRWKKARNQVFANYLPYYNILAKAAETSFASFCEVQKGFPEFVKKVVSLSREEEETRNGGAIDTSMGLPTDRAKSNRRRKPFYSPDRRSDTRSTKERHDQGSKSTDQNGDKSPDQNGDETTDQNGDKTLSF